MHTRQRALEANPSDVQISVDISPRGNYLAKLQGARNSENLLCQADRGPWELLIK